MGGVLYKPNIENGLCGVDTANISLDAAEYLEGRTVGFLVQESKVQALHKKVIFSDLVNLPICLFLLCIDCGLKSIQLQDNSALQVTTNNIDVADVSICIATYDAY